MHMMCICPKISSNCICVFYILLLQAQKLYGTIVGQSDYNITLPTILSEWHKLYNHSLQLGESLDRLGRELGGEYWMNWMPENSTFDLAASLQQRS